MAANKELKRSLAVETKDLIGQQVLLKGWITRVRDHGNVVFIDLRDRSGIIQIVGDKKFSGLSPEDVVEITGTVSARPEKLVNTNLPTGTVELQGEAFNVLEKAQELPFDLEARELKVELPTLLDHRPISLRHPLEMAIFKVQEVIVDAFRKALKAEGFTEFQAPTIVPVATEGGAQVFPIKYYDYNAFLCQSPQLYKQIMVGVFERVFSIARAYRAEPSVTTRHLSEYVSLDAEMGFIDSYEDVMNIVEKVIREIFKALGEQCPNELKLFGAELPKLSKEIPKIKMREAQEIIFKRTGRDNRKEPDLEPEDEKEICRWSLEEKGSDLVFITHFPMSKRPFYTFADPDDPEYSLSFDLLGKGLEWVTGGQRLNNYDQLVAAIKARGNDPRDFDIYLQAFKYGMPPEGGFALGAERITMQVLGLDNIRRASLFPRDMERIDFRLSTRKKSAVNDNAIFEKLIKLLDDKKIKYQLLEHKPVKTSEESAEVRGTPMDIAPKAMILKAASGRYVMVAIPADQQLDLAKVEKVIGEKVALAKPQDVEKDFGMQVGAVPPYGNILGIQMYLDKSFWEKEKVAFNAGRRDRSIIMSAKDLIATSEPQKGSEELSFTK